MKQTVLLSLLMMIFSAAFAQLNQWTWMSGDTVPFVKAVYGTKGVANAANNPGTRIRAYGWVTASGDFWLFGGQVYYDYPSSIDRSMSDLWKWDHSTGLWTWVSGDNFPFSNGIYGTQGVAGPNNRPGSRQRFITRTEASGKLLLFGGEGINSGSGPSMTYGNIRLHQANGPG